MSQDDDFYVEDESPEEFRAGWQRGEKGVTKGPRDLNQRAKSIVDRAVGRLDAPIEEAGPPVVRQTLRFTESFIEIDNVSVQGSGRHRTMKGN